MSLGKTIHQLRKRRGFTQSDLAVQLDIHPSMVTRWERDQVQPRITTLEKIASVLDTTVEEIMAGDYSRVGSTLREVDDPQLMDLFSQVNKLDPRDREALKTVMEAMLTRAKVQEAITR